MRRFETGATRDDDTNKLDFEGFLHPAVLLAFASYMHRHRLQPDGSLRASDNWQKGIPPEAYMKSLLRHVMDAWLYMRGCGDKARERVGDALCAIIFNAHGLLYELMVREGHIVRGAAPEEAPEPSSEECPATPEA